jgi:uncharacterized protein YsxB (DUF464 family)
MITCTFKYLDLKLKEVTVKGHANYKAHGKDIICAAVSTATILTANAIKHLMLDHLIDLTVDEGYFKISKKENHDIIDGLLKNLEHTLYELEKDYPKYMKNQKEG